MGIRIADLKGDGEMGFELDQREILLPDAATSQRACEYTSSRSQLYYRSGGGRYLGGDKIGQGTSRWNDSGDEQRITEP